jgi:ketosteroid isomerase-like protein
MVNKSPISPPEPTAPTGADTAIYRFIATLGAGELSAAAACFTRKGCMVTPDGTAVHGRADIAAILAQLIARRTEIEVEQLVVRQADDIALAIGWFAMRSDGPDGARVSQSCGPTAALQLVEGSWKIAVLAPWANR